MSRIKISDLSFCEVATDKDLEVLGGLSVAVTMTVGSLSNSLQTKFFTFTPVGYTHEQVYSGPDYVVEKLNNQTTGESGYAVSSKDGTSMSVVLTRGNSTSSFAMSVKSSSLRPQKS